MSVTPVPTPSNPTTLSTKELFQSVQALAPRVAVFDCDGTLWSGDAGSSFMHWTVETGLISDERIAWLHDRYEGYKRGEVSELAICGDMVRVYAGLREDELRAAATRFFAEKIEPHIFPELRRLIAELQEAGVMIWAVSSTNHWVIEEGVRRFNIPAERVLAARVAVKEGVISDIVLDVPTDEGKVEALRRMDVIEPDAVFGNSVHDAAMLAIARRAFPINPTPALEERSAREGWPVYHPQRHLHPSDKHVVQG